MDSPLLAASPIASLPWFDLRSAASVNPELVTCIGFLAAAAYAMWSARASGLNGRAMYWGVVWSLLAGLWGAHLLFLLVHGWEGGPLAALQFVQGGKSLFGGLFLGGLTGWIYLRYRKLPMLAYTDAVTPALALGYAIGRIACFLNGDDYGTLARVPWAVMYSPGTEAYAAHQMQGWIGAAASASLPIHPVQLYASLAGLVLFIVLAQWRTRPHGERLCVYLLGYGLARFVLEWLRGDFHPVLGAFSLPQIFSGVFVVLGLVLWYKLRRTGRDAFVDRSNGSLASQTVTRNCATSPIAHVFDLVYDSLQSAPPADTRL